MNVSYDVGAFIALSLFGLCVAMVAWALIEVFRR